MPFNAETYRMNRYRRDRQEAMNRARHTKERVSAGEAYDWEAERIGFHVRVARLSNYLLISQKRVVAIMKGEV
jgi:hypothetical protein